MAQPIEVVSIFIAAGDCRDTCHHHLEHRVSDAVGIAPIRHRVCKPPAHTERALLFSQQQQPAIGGLVAAVKINCELLAADGWKVEGKRRIVEHGGCGVGQMHIAIRRNTDLLRESRSSRYSRRKILTRDEFSGLDWRTGVARSVETTLKPRGYDLDWFAFADAWRAQYDPGMEEVRSGRIPYTRLDVLHRRMLDLFLPRFGVKDLPENVMHDLTL